MTNVSDQDVAYRIAWKARSLYLAAMGADIEDSPDLDALRSQALDLALEAEEHASRMDPGASETIQVGLEAGFQAQREDA
jgi:hypothetical protein